MLSPDGSCSTDCPAFVGCQMAMKTMVGLNTWAWFPGQKCVPLPLPVVVQARRVVEDLFDQDSKR